MSSILIALERIVETQILMPKEFLNSDLYFEYICLLIQITCKLSKAVHTYSCYNEEATIVQVLDKLKSIQLKNDIEKEYIIVNDASQDSSSDIISRYIADNHSMNICFIDHKNVAKDMQYKQQFKKLKANFYNSRCRFRI